MFRRRRNGVEYQKKYMKDDLISVVADAAIATKKIGDGRLIPLLILDTVSRPRLKEYIRVHKHFPPGDVVSQWATILDGSRRVALVLDLRGAMDMRVVIEFDPEKQGGVIDQIVSSKAVYIQAGKPGDRFIAMMDEPKVILEIPDTGFSRVWDELYFEAVVRRARKSGLSKKQANASAIDFITQFRKFGAARIGSEFKDKV